MLPAAASCSTSRGVRTRPLFHRKWQAAGRGVGGEVRGVGMRGGTRRRGAREPVRKRAMRAAGAPRCQPNQNCTLLPSQCARCKPPKLWPHSLVSCSTATACRPAPSSASTRRKVQRSRLRRMAARSLQGGAGVQGGGQSRRGAGTAQRFAKAEAGGASSGRGLWPSRLAGAEEARPRTPAARHSLGPGGRTRIVRVGQQLEQGHRWQGQARVPFQRASEAGTLGAANVHAALRPAVRRQRRRRRLGRCCLGAIARCRPCCLRHCLDSPWCPGHGGWVQEAARVQSACKRHGAVAAWRKQGVTTGGGRHDQRTQVEVTECSTGQLLTSAPPSCQI